MCIDCYVWHYYLSWYCHLAMERGVYMDELQTLQDFVVFRQALCLLMQYSHGEFKLYNMTIRINDQFFFQRSTCFLLDWDNAIGTSRFLWMSNLSYFVED